MKPDRRMALATAITGGVTLSLGDFSKAATQQVSQEEAKNDLDRLAVKSAGFTDDEADCWALLAKAVGKFFELPELHPLDKQEVATACHVIQNKLLSRPTYRTYVSEAKRLRGE